MPSASTFPIGRDALRDLGSRDPRLSFLRQARTGLAVLVIIQALVFIGFTWYHSSTPALVVDHTHGAAAIAGTSISSQSPSVAPAAPLVSPAAGPPARTVQSVHHSRSAAFLKYIEQLQHPADCRHAPLYVFLPTPYTSGLGSQLHIIANSMLQAISLRRTFVLDAATSAYVSPRRCRNRTYDCIFERASSCTLDDAFADPVINGTDGREALPTSVGDLRRAIASAEEPPRVVSGRASCFKFEREALAATLPPEVGDLGAPELGPPPEVGWYVRQVAGYLSRPNRQTRAIIDELGSNLSLSTTGGSGTSVGAGYIGVHIRRGDKNSEAVIHNTSVYARAVAAAARRHGVRRVLLASDDSEPFERLPRLLSAGSLGGALHGGGSLGGTDSAGAPGSADLAEDAASIEVVWVPHSQWMLSPHRGAIVAAKVVARTHEALAQSPTLSAGPGGSHYDEGMLLVAQAALLARAKALVGTLTSNYLLSVLEIAPWVRDTEPGGQKITSGASSGGATGTGTGAGVEDAADAESSGADEPEIIDLDGNGYYSCSVTERPPWGPAFASHKAKAH